MKTSDFSFDLPQELIAQDPLADRASSRLLVMDKETGAITHTHFSEIASYLRPGDVLVRNDTKVIPARLYGTKSGSGGKIEILLLKRLNDTDWEVLVKPGKRCRVGTKILFGNENTQLLSAEIKEVLPDGNRILSFSYEGIFEEVLDALGEMPLPPYIRHKLQDKARYNTVYAKVEGSAAAPTAGLHFTDALLDALVSKGVLIANVTLHVGLGTFRPVKEETVEAHLMHSEWYSIPAESADIINRAKEEGRRVICVGTTSCRTVESAADENGRLRATSDETSIFIYPGYRFRVTDGLITNFHLPESTLLMLVSALAGREHILAAYAEAVRERYRFFSFGDAMLLI